LSINRKNRKRAPDLPAPTGLADFKRSLDRFLSPVTRLLAGWGVTPDHLTLFGVVLSVPIAVFLVMEKFPLAGLWLLFAGAFDTLDGAMARQMGRSTKFGAFYDSTMDRFSEAVVFVGFIILFYQRRQPEELILAFAASVFSQTVPYTRARAEGLGLRCEVGILPRWVRVIVLGLGLILGVPVWALWVVAVGSFITTVQRILHVRKLTAGAKPS
jgi:CDP-diacylglycerol---glycerol-3-phosphate 3-phosphatidyltransferase